MAESCKEQQVKVEEEVLQPVDKWVNQQEQRCREEECKWWMLCLNKLFCWLVWVLVKITEWVLIVVIRWVYRIVCVTVTLVVGLLVFIFDPSIFFQAVKDLLELVEDAFYFVLGAVLFYGNYAIDFILTTIGVQDAKRKLTDNEIAILRRIYGDSLAYDLIRVNEGRLGIMGPPFATAAGATTMGYYIYYRSGPTIDDVTLVHESVHVWQFQFGGTQYIGQSVVFQIADAIRNDGTTTYDWWTMIGVDPDGWYLMKSIEARAEFVEDLYNNGTFNFDNGTVDSSNGAFFQESKKGDNEFIFMGVDHTDQGNAAWSILRTG